MKEEKEENINENFSDKFDVVKFIASIKLRIRKDITNDFVLARLEDKDKEAIIEMTSNAYFAKKLLLILANKSKIWIWDEKRKEHKQVNLPKEQIKYLKSLSDGVFDSYMTRIYMTVILNRNVDKNYLINVLSGYKEEAEEDINISPEEASNALKDIVKNQEKEK